MLRLLRLFFARLIRLIAPTPIRVRERRGMLWSQGAYSRQRFRRLLKPENVKP